MRENPALVLQTWASGQSIQEMYFCQVQLRKKPSCWTQIEDGTGEVWLHVQEANYKQQYKY